MFILLNHIAINAQNVNESFAIRNTSDNIWGLKFYSNKQYEYYKHDLISDTYTIIEKGTYQKNKNKLTLSRVKQFDSKEENLPEILYYSRLSKNTFESLDSKPFAYTIRSYILWKRFHLLSNSK